MTRLLPILAAAALAWPAYAQAPAATTQPQVSAETKQFVEKATIGDKYEIESSRMALEKAQGDEFKRFAQRIVDDHTKASDEMKSIVQKMQGLQAPTELDAKHKQMIDRLRSASGGQFNEQYRTQQIEAHNEAVRLYEQYAGNGDNAELKQFASKTLPTLKQHLEMAQALPQGAPAPGVAQAPAGERQGQAQQRRDGQASAAGGARQQAGQGEVISRPGPDHILASDLHGTTVYGMNNEKIGDVNEVVLSRSGEVVAVVVGVGGFLGIGEKNVAIPFDALDVRAAGETTGQATPTTGASGDRQAGRSGQGTVNPDRIVLRGMTKQDLQNAPKFENKGNR